MKRKPIITAIFFLVLCILIKLFLFDNFNFLVTISEGLDKPSPQYNFFVNRIYNLTQSKKIDKIIIDSLSSGKQKNLHLRFYRFLGVIGGDQAYPTLKKQYEIKNDSKQENNINNFYIISSIGLTGDPDSVNFLENLLQKEKAIPGALVAQSLFLVTGKKYNFLNQGGDIEEFFADQDLLKMREVISNSSGRKRNPDELRLLDKLFR